MKIPHIKRTIRNTKRLAEIIRVLMRFGFKQVVTESGLLRLLESRADHEEQELYSDLPKPQRVRMMLEELGPTFIKLGQILASRPDLIPHEWADEFKVLQENCKKVDFSYIDATLNEDFPSRRFELFDHIEKVPIAAGSIAQVHKAVLATGENVVVKILRPGIRELLEEDMALMEFIAEFVENYFSDLGYSPTSVAKEFSREIQKEVNLIHEGQATERLRRYFKESPHISFPKVYWQATTRNILTLEYVDGQVLSTVNPADLNAQIRRSIVMHGTDAVFKQCLQFGFFHGDPHPGNIILRPDNGLCFIDCGMTGQLDNRTMEQLIDLIAAIIKGDIDKLCRVVVQLTNTPPAVTDRRDFRAELQHLTAGVKDIELKHINISSLLSDFFSMLQRYKITCPGDLILLTKALTTIEGIAENIDPEFDVLAHVEPEISRIVVARYGIKGMQRRLQRTFTDYIELVEDLPADLQRFLDYVRQSRFTLNLEMKRIEHLADKVDMASRMMGMAMIISALIVGSSILILADAIAKNSTILRHLGMAGLLLSGAYAIGFVGSFLLPKKKNKD